MNKEDLEKLSPKTLGQLNDALHEVLCKSNITLMKDSLENPGIAKEKIMYFPVFIWHLFS